MHGHTHIAVISHRRSGTHLTIDAISNNFRGYADVPLLTFRQLVPGWEKSLTLEEYRFQMDSGSHLLKSHFLPDPGLYFADDPDNADFLKSILSNSPKIYIYRDGRDVMVSLFRYMQHYDQKVKSQSFSDFIRDTHDFGPEGMERFSRVGFWKFHVESWLDYGDDILYLSFEEVVTNYSDTMVEIATFIAQSPPGQWVDVRLKKENLLEKTGKKIRELVFQNKIKRTTVLFEEGKTGIYKKYFNADDLDYFNKTAGELLHRLNYD